MLKESFKGYHETNAAFTHTSLTTR